jgi:hypothetical protein
MFKTGVIVEGFHEEGSQVKIDVGDEACDYELNLNHAICLTKHGFLCSLNSLESGNKISFFAGSTVVYDETNNSPRADYVPKCYIVWKAE